MHHDHAIAGEVHVEFEAVGAERQPVIEGGDRVFWAKRRPPAVGIDERPLPPMR
jgi:hypothetical protein